MRVTNHDHGELRVWENVVAPNDFNEVGSYAIFKFVTMHGEEFLSGMIAR